MSDKITNLPDGGSLQDTDEFVAARAGANVKIAGSALGTGGSITPVTHTATVTTDANTFLVTHDFDLGYPTVAYFGGTVTALTPDGETFGGGAGNIAVDVSALVSNDGTTWYGTSIGGGVVAWPLIATLRSDPEFAVAGVVDGAITTTRFVRVLVFIYDNDAGDIYAGANHPRATCDLAVTAI